jgi:hypothetical protein
MEKYYSSSETRVLRFATMLGAQRWGATRGKRIVHGKSRKHLLIERTNLK